MSGYVSFIDFSTIATPRDDPYSRYTYKKQRSDDNACSQQDLLALVDSLRLELRVKESRLRDMEEYMDNLVCQDYFADLYCGMKLYNSMDRV
ncbi:hypothetical protein Y032_0004g1914 [Ancylostoma ceylanicum]|uniref:Uncharacterized protein n=1 Tax=Ancylostoma ceylanicum TaxID=53326 RepID=A0A016VU09_9BILA|nr:hypothetical protein Y032_0004g1914 [Ancylostoma ceylanicum]